MQTNYRNLILGNYMRSMQGNDPGFYVQNFLLLNEDIYLFI
jgi:hypothetical protein